MIKHLRLLIVLSMLFAVVLSCSSPDDNSVVIDEAFYNYGKVSIGSTIEYEFVITNNKATDIIVDIVRFLGKDFNEFELGLDSETPLIIPSKRSKNFRIRFVPARPVGKKSATAQIAWAGSYGTFEIKLKGEAVDAPVAIAEPLSHDYDQVIVGFADTRQFVVTNNGFSDLIIGSSFLSGLDASQFTITAGVTGGTVPPGGTFEITVDATPNTPGFKEAILEVPHNAYYYKSPINIMLSYFALEQTRILLTNTVGKLFEFPPTEPDDPVTGLLEITNDGNCDLTISDIVVTGTEFSLISGGAGSSGAGDVIVPKNGGVHIVELEFEASDPDIFYGTIEISSDATNVLPVHELDLRGDTMVTYGDGSNDYVFSEFTRGMQRISGGDWVAQSNIDDGNVLVPIGFTFYYYGNPWTNISAGSNGGIIFANTNIYLTIGNTTFPNTNTNLHNTVAGWHDDLYYWYSLGSEWKYITEGSAPNRVFTIEFYNFSRFYTNFAANFQIKLYERSNVIEMHYSDTPSWYTSFYATIGINSDDGTRGHSVSGSPNLSTLPPNNYRYTPIP